MICCLFFQLKEQNNPHLLCKFMSCFEVEVSSYAPQKTNDKLSPLIHSIQVWERIHYSTHQASFNHKVILVSKQKTKQDASRLCEM